MSKEKLILGKGALIRQKTIDKYLITRSDSEVRVDKNYLKRQIQEKSMILRITYDYEEGAICTYNKLKTVRNVEDWILINSLLDKIGFQRLNFGSSATFINDLRKVTSLKILEEF